MPKKILEKHRGMVPLSKKSAGKNHKTKGQAIRAINQILVIIFLFNYVRLLSYFYKILK